MYDAGYGNKLPLFGIGNVYITEKYFAGWVPTVRTNERNLRAYTYTHTYTQSECGNITLPHLIP